MKSINDIPKSKYEGYIWYSNEKQPIVLSGKDYFSFDENENDNPFVIEALLFDKENQVSITIRHTGTFLIKIFDLKNLPQNAILSDTKEYYPHRLGNEVSKVCFKQLWIPEKDLNCEEMEVFNMKAFIFTGFKYK